MQTIPLLLLLVTLLLTVNGEKIPIKNNVLLNEDVTSEWAVELSEGNLPYHLEEQGFEVVKRVGEQPNTYVVRHINTHSHSLRNGGKIRRDESVTNILRSHPSVEWAEQQIKIRNEKDTVPTDPLFHNQWHIKNNGQLSGSTDGIDINIIPAWDAGYTGKGVTVAIVDDGYQYTHPELVSKYTASLSRNFNEGNPNDPFPQIDDGNQDYHGTACAGVLLAEKDNSVCGVGVAHDAFGVGIRVLGKGGITDATQYDAYTFGMDKIDVFSNSYGVSTGGVILGFAGRLTLAALDRCRTEGRNGKGNIFVFSAGNGALDKSNSNYRGYTANRYSIAVAALDFNGKQAYYSEPGANLLVSAPSGTNSNNGIRTADIMGAKGYSSTDCAEAFDGTSAACPMVAGVAALILQVNSSLHWRDIQYILASTAKKTDITDSDWVTNGNGMLVNHKYGFGLVDAFAAVNAAKVHSSLPSEVKLNVTKSERMAIPDNSVSGITLSFEVTEDIFVESAVLSFKINHESANEIEIELTSPAGTKSILAQRRGQLNAVTVGNEYAVTGFSTYGLDMTREGSSVSAIGQLSYVLNENCSLVSNCELLPGKIALVHGSAYCKNYVRMTKSFQDCGAVGVIVYEVDVNNPDNYYRLTGEDTNNEIVIPTIDMSYNSYAQLQPSGKQILIQARTIKRNLYLSSWSVNTKRVLGEGSKGTWILKIADKWELTTGTFEGATLEVYGHYPPTTTTKTTATITTTTAHATNSISTSSTVGSATTNAITAIPTSSNTATTNSAITTTSEAATPSTTMHPNGTTTNGNNKVPSTTEEALQENSASWVLGREALPIMAILLLLIL